MADVLPALTLAEPLLTAEQVAALLGVPRTSVYEYARRSRDPLPAVRVGRHVRFRRTAVEHWLARRES
jgi:excisionase family DNA binding protein